MKKSIITAVFAVVAMAGCAAPAEEDTVVVAPVQLSYDQQFIASTSNLPQWGTEEERVELAKLLCTAFDAGLNSADVEGVITAGTSVGTHEERLEFMRWATRYYCSSQSV